MAESLSAMFVKKVSAPGKYHDRGGTGLFLRVDQSKAKRWVQRVTIRGRRHEIGHGAPPIVTLAMARAAALKIKRDIIAGVDPLAERRKSREVLTFANAVDRYLTHKLTEFRNEKHKRQWRATLDTYAVLVLGPKPVAEIETRDVLRVLEPIWATKTETASRLRGRIEAVLSWATVAGHRTGDNPARWKGNLAELLAKPGKVAKAGNQPALALADVPRWWQALTERTGMSALALQFLTLTAARSGEVRGATWAEIDLDANIWTIPADRMKAGREHRVALPEASLAILRAVPRILGYEYVFPAARGGALSDMALSQAMRRLHADDIADDGPGFKDARSGRPAVPHGIRSSFRDWAAERGYERDMAEIALAHTVGSEVERSYRRTDMLERRRTMQEAWAQFLRGEAAGENVVSMKAGG